MTPEQAVEILNGKGDSISVVQRVQANRMGAEAIEGCMIGKTPIFKFDMDFRCPKCSAFLDVMYRSKFCNKCGQKLDWSEVE